MEDHGLVMICVVNASVALLSLRVSHAEYGLVSATVAFFPVVQPIHFFMVLVHVVAYVVRSLRNATLLALSLWHYPETGQ